MHDSPILGLVVVVLALLFLASVIAIVAKRIRFPFTILLVITGLGLGWLVEHVELLHFLSTFKLSPDIVMFIFLPVLLFESAYNLNARYLIKNALPIIMLAVPGLLISAAITGTFVHYLLGLPLVVALLFGALISATDPVAVVALFKEMGAPKRLHLLVEGESLFNDGTALVVFNIILGVIAAGVFTGSTVVHGIMKFALVASVGIAVGIALGVVFSKIIELVENDHLVEITLTTILAHTAFLTAEHLGASGVMATVAAGLTMGSYGMTKISPQVQKHMEHFWEYFAFVCNSLLFLLVGLSVSIPLFIDNAGAILVAVVIVLVARALAVYGVFPVIESMRITEPVSKSFQTVIVWGGLRGALAIVMALSIPDSIKEKPFILVMTLGIVLFTLLVNGLTIKKLMSLLGLDRYSSAELVERFQAMVDVKEHSLSMIVPYCQEQAINPNVAKMAENKYKTDIDYLGKEYEKYKSNLGAKKEAEVELRHCLLLEKSHYRRLFEEGVLSETNLKDMLLSIERQLDRIKEDKEVYLTGGGTFSSRLLSMAEKIGWMDYVTSRLKTARIASSYEIERARYTVSAEVLKDIKRDTERGILSPSTLEVTLDLYKKLHKKAMSRMNDIKVEFPEYVEKTEANILLRLSLNQEMKGYRELFSRGAVPEKVYQEMMDSITDELRTLKMRPVKELLISPAKLLGMVPYFSELDDEHLRMLLTKVHAKSFLLGETIVKQGHKGESLYIIGRGKVEVSALNEEGQRVHLANLETGDFFGETVILHPQPRTATVIASSPCTLLELSRDSILPLLSEVPKLKKVLDNAYRSRVLNTLLAVVPAFKSLSSEERDYLSSKMEFQSYEPGVVMAEADAVADKFFVIVDGVVELYEESKLIKKLTSGGYFGALEMVTARPYPLSLKAQEKVNTFVLNLEVWRKLKG